MLDFSARASPSLRNPTSFCYKSLLFCELLQVAIAICDKKYLKHAEELLFGELAALLDISLEEVPKVLFEKLYAPFRIESNK